MKLAFYTDYPQFLNDYLDVVKAFEPHIVFDKEAEDYVRVDIQAAAQSLAVTISSTFANVNRYAFDISGDSLEIKRLIKRYSKRELYFYLSGYLNIKLPYGSLTGIRPTKLYYDLTAEGLDADSMLGYFGVSEGKAQIIREIIEAQRGIYKTEQEKYDYFVNIPFCPSRCAYCSFISEIISRVKNRLEEYVGCLIRDIGAVDMPRELRRAIYIGGGTPTSLPHGMLDSLLKAVRRIDEEFTVEAGRPDTLTEDTVAVLKNNGVTRVSVNPQTFKQSTLARIGRAHSVDDIYRAYTLVDRAGFSVNMDLITMLPDETVEDFADSVDRAVQLAPDNITIHSLSVKRGALLNLEGYHNNADSDKAAAMSDYAYNALKTAGYVPYYMYRQKNTAGRLENIGYTKKGKACVYNIDIMEETHAVYASGAGAISKRLFGGERIERLAEVKDISGYIERIDELIERKKIFFN